MRGTWALAAGTCVLMGAGVAGCGGGPRQDASEPSGTFKVEVVSAKFPRRQSIAQPSALRIRVRNADRRPLPDVAVTVETRAQGGSGAAQAFSEDISDTHVADPSRPIWILDEAPSGGTTAATNTWALGRLGPGQTAEFVWKVTAVKAGSYTLGYRVSPGLTGKAKPSGADSGEFRVKIDDRPPDASVNDQGKVVNSLPSGQ